MCLLIFRLQGTVAKVSFWQEPGLHTAQFIICAVNIDFFLLEAFMAALAMIIPAF